MGPVGSRLPAPSVYLGAQTLDFGSQAISSTTYAHSVYVHNNGEAALTFHSIAVIAADGDNAAADYQIVTGTTYYDGPAPALRANSIGPAYFNPYYDTCAGSLAPGNSCYVYMTFTPSAAGPRRAHLQLVDDDATVT